LDEKNKIDLKKSSFKKIGRLLELMSDSTKIKGAKGIISYNEDKRRGHKLITEVFK